MDILLIPLFNLVNTVLTLFVYVLIASVVMSWLLAFGVVNTQNQFVATLSEVLFRLTEPVLRPIRSLMPDLGGIDISPVILILGIYFFRDLFARLIAALVGA